MKARVLACAAALVVAAGACGGTLHVPPHIVLDPGGVSVEGSLGGPKTEEDFPAALNSFFPSKLTVHAGDRVFFDAEYTGQLHTVTLGTLVDDAAQAIEDLGRGATHQEAEALPEMQRLPSPFPKAPGEGPLRANRSATEPCFLDEGAPPNPQEGGASACPERDQPDLDGSQTFYSSGWMGESTFELRFSEDIPEGTHAFMCLVHRSRMMGTVEVVGEDEDRPSQSEVAGAGRARRSALIASLETPADDLRKATSQRAAAGKPSATGVAELTAFFPKRIEIDQGDTVSWAVSGIHAISLDPSEAPGELVVEVDGARVFNQAVVTPSAGAPAVPPRTLAYPPPRDGRPVALSATWDGEGSFNSGLLLSTPPMDVTYELTFTRTGTYALQCLVHPLMHAVVEVS